MDRIKGFWIFLARASSPRRSQVIHFSHLSRTLSGFCRRIGHRNFLSTHLNVSFPSNSLPGLMVKAIRSSDWSEDLEKKLSSSNPRWTRQTVVYVLRNIATDSEKAAEFSHWVCDQIGFERSDAVYSLLLRVLVTRGSLVRFWQTLGKMKNQGFNMDEETYLAIRRHFVKSRRIDDAAALTDFYNMMVRVSGVNEIVSAVADVIKGCSEWDDEVEDEIGKLQVSVSDMFIFRVLKELHKEPLKALWFFRWVSRRHNYSHSAITYNGMVRVLGKHKSIAEFWNMVEEMQAVGYELHLKTYLRISRQLQGAEMMEDMVKLYELVMDGPCKPPTKHSVHLLHCLGRKKCLNPFFRAANKYEESGGAVSKLLYNQVYEYQTRVGSFDEAERIMKAMENAGYAHDTTTYNHLVRGLCKARRLEEARVVMEGMEAWGCMPNSTTRTFLIKGYFAANQFDKALSCFTEVLEKNHGADADLMGIMIDGFLHRNRVDGARALLTEMVERERLRPWPAMYEKVITRLLERRKLAESMELLRLMVKHNCPPSHKPFDDYISRFGTVEDASEYLRIICSKDYWCSSPHLRIFRSFIQAGRSSEAEALFRKCAGHIQKDEEIGKLFDSVNSGRL